MDPKAEYYLEKAAALQRQLAARHGFVRARHLRRILSLVLTVLWYVFWIDSSLAYFARPYATFNPKNVMMYISAAVLLLLPFALFKPQRLFTDRTFCGRVTRTCSHNRVGNTTLSKSTRLTLTVRRFDNGKLKTLRLTLRPGLREYYPEGCAVCKLSGVPYPVRLDADQAARPRDTVLCHHCGWFNPRRYERCFECSRKLFIK